MGAEAVARRLTAIRGNSCRKADGDDRPVGVEICRTPTVRGSSR
jgi:hypothetical protein